MTRKARRVVRTEVGIDAADVIADRAHQWRILRRDRRNQLNRLMIRSWERDGCGFTPPALAIGRAVRLWGRR